MGAIQKGVVWIGICVNCVTPFNLLIYKPCPLNFLPTHPVDSWFFGFLPSSAPLPQCEVSSLIERHKGAKKDWLRCNRAHCRLQTAHCTLYTVHCSLHTAHCTLHTVQCTLHIKHWTLHTAHWTLHTTHLKLHTAHFTLYTAHYMLYTAHCTQ